MGNFLSFGVYPVITQGEDTMETKQEKFESERCIQIREKRNLENQVVKETGHLYSSFPSKGH